MTTTTTLPARRSCGRVLRARRRRPRAISTLVLAVMLLPLAHSASAVTLPQLSVSDVTIAAPGSGTARATFVVTLSEASTKTVTVRYRTADGSATAPDDYEPTSGTLRFAPGETSQTVSVGVNASPVPVTEKVFYLELFDPSNATIADPQGVATIVNDLPSIAISDSRIAEPPPGELSRAIVTVSLSTPSSRTVRVHFAATDGSAVAGEDYEPVSGVLTFRPGEGSKNVSVAIRNDGVSSPDETLWLELAAPSNAQLARSAGEITIVDWDRVISINDTAILQPDPGTEAAAAFDVVLSEPTSGSTQPTAGFPTSVTVTVDFTTVDGSAVADVDYTPVSGTIVFRPGESSKKIFVPVRNNGVAAADRVFFLQLSKPTNARLARSLGTAGVLASNRTVTIEDTAATDTGTPGDTARLAVSLSAAAPQPVTVRYATANGTALAGVDYGAQSGTVVFEPGEISKTIAVPILNDVSNDSPETPETFYVELAGADNAQIARARATVTIVDNDQFLSMDDDWITADPATPVDAVFTVTLSQAASTPVRVDFSTADGTATAGHDYEASSGTLTFAAGETTATIAVPVTAHPDKGPDRTFSVRLSSPVNAKLLRAEATGTITTRGRGYWLVAADGGIFAFGEAGFFGSTGAIPLNLPIVGMAPTPSGNGYWLVAADGGIFAFGDAGFFGSTGALTLARPIVGMAPTPSGNGYWLVAADGGIFAFGDAGFFGSTGALTLASPVVGMASTPTGNGYWLVAADGGIFTFGDGRFFGSGARTALTEAVVGMAATPSGNGYWLVAGDGGVLAFGDAPFAGSGADKDLKSAVVGIARTASGHGYWLVAADGTVVPIGDARSFGSPEGTALNEAIVGVGRVP